MSLVECQVHGVLVQSSLIPLLPFQNAHPEFAGLGADSCTYQFNFVTPLACNDLEPCTAFTATNEL